MLKFFRKIRQNLIAKGDVKRYLLYTIGEILLVVIGILFALQINTWNNNRIDRKLEKVYLKRLVQDLNADLLDANETIDYCYRRLLLAEKVIDTLGGKSISDWPHYKMALANYSDIAALMAKPFGKTLTDIRMYHQFDGTKVTFQELLTNGKLDIIRNKALKENIQHHYNSLQSKLHTQRMVANARDGFVEQLVANGINMTTEQNYAELKPYLKNEKVLLAHIDNVNSLATASLNSLLLADDAIKKNTEQLIAEIEIYLLALE